MPQWPFSQVVDARSQLISVALRTAKTILHGGGIPINAGSGSIQDLGFDLTDGYPNIMDRHVQVLF